ncbi:teichoic acid biosynthesis protein B [Candidatus Saccharibacteria bacterium HGW-Saccharibacteria-1]|jgi:hypothetical protein|nr:MAG: teichoic acid biosynthesis protein B [Candidatus Saccharibacteria bacterium HGW-Saccharibacteria-1]
MVSLSFKRLFSNLHYLKLSDFVSIFKFILVYPIAIIYRIYLKWQEREPWLICESPDTARDNGYHFYAYLKKEHPEIESYYAIKNNSPDRKKLERLGGIINYGSIGHWIYYLSAKENISTQKGGNPSPAIFYLLHIYGLIRNNRTFLQHGITKDNLKWLYFNETKFKLFICGANDEYLYIKQKFGYPSSNVINTGFARFDMLHDISINKRQVLIMPTWRNWLGRDTNFLDKNKDDFINSKFYQDWMSLLNNKKFNEYILDNNLQVCFYLHFNMQKYADFFMIKNNNIKILKKEDVDIQTLLKESAILITDYSSVFFDFAYMQKPIIYYQFDQEEYRKKQYQQGYFSYSNNGFGPICKSNKSTVNNLIKSQQNNFAMTKPYIERVDKFFGKIDKNNSERIFKAIKNYEMQ